MFREPITCSESIEVLSHSFSIFKVGPKGKPSTTTFTRLSYNGTSSVVKCEYTSLPFIGLGLYSHTILKNVLYLVFQIFLCLAAFECNTTSD